jgi:hypothetical protein
MGVVHRTREKKKNKRAKSVCSLAQKGKSGFVDGKKAPLLASIGRCVMCCFQCEVNTHRQKRARDYFEVRVNVDPPKKKHKTTRENAAQERKTSSLVQRNKSTRCIINAIIKI